MNDAACEDGYLQLKGQVYTYRNGEDGDAEGTALTLLIKVGSYYDYGCCHSYEDIVPWQTAVEYALGH